MSNIIPKKSIKFHIDKINECPKIKKMGFRYEAKLITNMNYYEFAQYKNEKLNSKVNLSKKEMAKKLYDLEDFCKY